MNDTRRIYMLCMRSHYVLLIKLFLIIKFLNLNIVIIGQFFLVKSLDHETQGQACTTPYMLHYISFFMRKKSETCGSQYKGELRCWFDSHRQYH